MDTYKIASVALIVCVVTVLLKEYKPVFSLVVAVLAGAVMLLAVLTKFAPFVEDLKYLVQESGIDNAYFEIMLKSLGICYIAQFATDICNDFGQTSLASKIELSAKLTLAVLSLAPVTAIIKIIKEMV